MSLNNTNNIMFISENGLTVYEEEFRRLVIKYQSKDDIEFYMKHVSHHTNNFFEGSNNMEVIVFQNIIWNKVLKIDLEESGETLYFKTYNLITAFKNLIKNEYEQPRSSEWDITNYYKELIKYNSVFKDLKCEFKLYLKRMETDFPLYNFGFNELYLRISNMYYRLKDVIYILFVKLQTVKVSYEKYKKDTIVTTALCFKNDFGLPFKLKIEEKALMGYINSYLYL